MSIPPGTRLVHDSGTRLGEVRHSHDDHVVQVIDGPNKYSSGVVRYVVECLDCNHTFETRESCLSAKILKDTDSSGTPIFIDWDTAPHDSRGMLVALTALAAALDYVDPVEAAVNVMEDPELRNVMVTPTSLRRVIEKMKEA